MAPTGKGKKTARDHHMVNPKPKTSREDENYHGHPADPFARDAAWNKFTCNHDQGQEMTHATTHGESIRGQVISMIKDPQSPEPAPTSILITGRRGGS